MEEQGEDKDEQESRLGGDDDGEVHLDQVLPDRVEGVSLAVFGEADGANDADDVVGGTTPPPPLFLSVIISDKVSALWPGIGGPCEFKAVGKDDGSDNEGAEKVVGGDKGKAGEGRDDEEMACCSLQVVVLEDKVDVVVEEMDKGGDDKEEEGEEEEEEYESSWRTG